MKDALKEQMVAPVRWVRVVETLAKMRVEEWVELGGGGVLTRMLKDFELPSLNGITFEDLRPASTDRPRTSCHAKRMNRLQTKPSVHQVFG